MADKEKPKLSIDDVRHALLTKTTRGGWPVRRRPVNVRNAIARIIGRRAPEPPRPAPERADPDPPEDFSGQAL